MPGTVLKKRSRIGIVGVGVFLFSVALPVLSGAEKKLSPKPAPAGKPAARSSTAKKPAAKSSKTTVSRKASSKSRRKKPQAFRYRLARLKLQPGRITEIQSALAQAGYLNQEPNGKWDDPTRTAMLRYQRDHGFPATGLPEAKSLMKLGLGPHPLPEELDSTAQAGTTASPFGDPGAPSPATTDHAGTVPAQ